ncbi:hypothetical protein SAMN05421747_1282 [Parapedobacter composti]|uniref:Uncharacterized protein n=1 Tax=Parapedobacter composti TaxID=623281 RepID=A0A1I1M282_9SPHI|nr:hypothetical protein SAMN05421747_1282 [Parapedobacter composti]
MSDPYIFLHHYYQLREGLYALMVFGFGVPIFGYLVVNVD